ncbi:XkdW family protein [Bacillus cytotoxicus]|uniref:XkdW family protein n=1 Tax=Bacillus cytotoxicus TaxID=580165 RepID=A0ACC6A6B8_9BACI|nr:XkdW family protein [Bacillus cytotoxicus]
MLLETNFNIGDAILYLFPGSVPNIDFRVTFDGIVFRLVEWNMLMAIPDIQTFEKAFNDSKIQSKPPVEKPSIESRICAIEEALNAIIMKG